MLRFDDVRVTRGAFTLRADWSVAAGARVAVIGPSGGGKSTLLALVAGFLLPDAGAVTWQGRDLAPLAPGRRPVAMLFQDNNLFPHLDVLTNVALGADPSARPSADARSRAAEALDCVGLAGFEHRFPGALSGGQQSRAALARVLLTDRPVVCLDEAFAALGPALRAEMLALVDALLPTATVLTVTHDPDDAKACARSVVFVEGGIARAPKETSALFDAPDEALRRYLR